MKLAVKWRLFVLQVVSGLVIAFICGEVYLRYFYENRSSYSERSFIPYLITGHYILNDAEAEPPDLYSYKKNGLIYTYDALKPVSSITDRGHEIFQGRLSQEAGRKNVFILGGSVSQGMGASTWDGRWFVLLEKELRERLKDDSIDVIPAAISSLVSTQERLILDFFVLPSKPVAVVNLDAYNDASVMMYGARPGDPPMQGLLYARLSSFRYQLVAQLSRVSRLIKFYFENYVASRIREQAGSILASPEHLENYISSVVSVYSDNVQAMAKRCDQEKVACFFLMQPMKALDKNDVTPKIYERMRSAVQQKKKEWPINYYDFTAVFDQESVSPIYDHVHFGDRGHVIMAKAVADLLIQNKKMWYK